MYRLRRRHAVWVLSTIVIVTSGCAARGSRAAIGPAETSAAPRPAEHPTAERRVDLPPKDVPSPVMRMLRLPALVGPLVPGNVEATAAESSGGQMIRERSERVTVTLPVPQRRAFVERLKELLDQVAYQGGDARDRVLATRRGRPTEQVGPQGVTITREYLLKGDGNPPRSRPDVAGRMTVFVVPLSDQKCLILASVAESDVDWRQVLREPGWAHPATAAEKWELEPTAAQRRARLGEVRGMAAMRPAAPLAQP